MFSWLLKLLGIEDDKPVAKKAVVVEATVASPPINESKEAIDTINQVANTIIEPEPEPELPLAEVFPALKANYIKVLSEAGFASKEAINKASDKELLGLKGIGKATLKILRS